MIDTFESSNYTSELWDAWNSFSWAFRILQTEQLTCPADSSTRWTSSTLSKILTCESTSRLPGVDPGAKGPWLCTAFINWLLQIAIALCLLQSRSEKSLQEIRNEVICITYISAQTTWCYKPSFDTWKVMKTCRHEISFVSFSDMQYWWIWTSVPEIRQWSCNGPGVSVSHWLWAAPMPCIYSERRSDWLFLVQVSRWRPCKCTVPNFPMRFLSIHVSCALARHSKIIIIFVLAGTRTVSATSFR